MKSQRRLFQKGSLRSALRGGALLAAMAAAACSAKTETAAPSASASTAASTPAAGGGEIVVGEYGTLTGSDATFGQSTHAGVTMALQEANAAGGINGKQIKIINYDDAGKAQEAGTAVTRLITNDKVVAVLGEVASSRSLAGGRVAQQYGVPMITPASTNEAVTQIGDMVSRVCFIDPYQGFVCAKFLRDNLKFSTAAILYDQTQAYSKGLKENFSAAFTKLGGKIVSEQSYSGGDADFSAQLTTIREAKPDAIFVPGYYTEVGNIALQSRKLGMSIPMIGGDGWDSVKLLEIAGHALDGCYYSNHYSSEDSRPEVQEFVTKYRAANNGETPDVMAALGYDAARVLFDAMKRAPSLGGKDLAKAIAETKDFHGVTGTITLDKDRNAEKGAVILQIKDGKVSYLTSVNPASP